MILELVSSVVFCKRKSNLGNSMNYCFRRKAVRQIGRQQSKTSEAILAVPYDNATKIMTFLLLLSPDFRHVHPRVHYNVVMCAVGCTRAQRGPGF